jgi:hypothetical protein
MVFGAWGNPDHDDAVRIIHRALADGINVIDTPTSTPAASPRIVGNGMWARWGSNPRPSDYEAESTCPPRDKQSVDLHVFGSDVHEVRSNPGIGPEFDSCVCT